ncbi:MAG: type II toxin-antitoxin system Phd/YefM family antitoxin [Candidatus Acidiferrales bacterium]
MRTVGLFEAKQKLSELVDRAAKGEKVGITRHGKLEVYIVSAHPEIDVGAVFDRIEELRKRVKPHKRLTARQMIIEGRK